MLVVVSSLVELTCVTAQLDHVFGVITEVLEA